MKTEFLKCNECGMVAEVMVPCHCDPPCTMVCCGKPLQRLTGNTTDGAKEKLDEHTKLAKDALTPFGDKAEFLLQFADMLLNRKN